MIAVFLDDNFVIAIVVSLLVNDNRPVTVPFFVTGTNGHPDRPNTYANSYLFCYGRHCGANTRYGSN